MTKNPNLDDDWRMVQGTGNNGNGLHWFWRVLAGLVVLAVSAIAAGVAANSYAISGLRSGGMSAKEVGEKHEEIHRRINALALMVAEMPANIQVPPAWFLDRMDRLEDKVDDLASDVAAIKRQPN